jgi:hypothetical protein
MWNIIQDGLYAMFRRNKEIYEVLADFENKVISGETSPTKAASIILDKFIKSISNAESFWDLISD